MTVIGIHVDEVAILEFRIAVISPLCALIIFWVCVGGIDNGFLGLEENRDIFLATQTDTWMG